MKIKHLFIIVIVFISFGFGSSTKLQKKINKVITSTFKIETFTFNPITILPEFTKGLPSKFGEDNFFDITSSNKLIGYAYIAKAPSKTAQFDYLVLLNTNLVILKTKVLIYREEYGGEIGSKRWLRQFIGKTTDDEFKHGETIDAIAGATISVRSMTKAMNDLMKSLKTLNIKGVL